MTVNFTDLSTGNPTSWAWNFGNGNTSTLQNPGVIYVNPGTYTVTLTASKPGSSDMEVKTAYITVYADPTANFQANLPLTGCAPLSVHFTDLSQPGSGTLTQWLWDFGDGTNSTQANPTHLFKNPGNYPVTLFVSNSHGCQDGFTITNYIHVLDTPVAAFLANPNSACTAPATFSFVNNTTGSAPLSYQWVFGDGGTSNAGFPSHTYQNSGNFNVTLIATNVHGCKDTLVEPNYINIGSITANFTAAPLSGCPGTTVNFTDASLGGVGAWNWDFGDGFTSTLQNPSHTYANPGNYTVTLIASNGPGCSNQVIKTSYITIHPIPVISFTADTTEACSLPFTVHFTNNTVGGAYYVWHFGDGTTSTQTNPTHTYTTEGTFDVKVYAISAGGCADSLEITTYIQVLKAKADFLHSSSPPTFKGCAPLEVNFYDLSFSWQPIVSWHWDFGDGNSSNQQNPTHIYNSVGNYTVSLIIVNDWGCQDTLIVPNHVAVGDTPTVNFVVSPQNHCAGAPVFFNNLSTGNEWQWFFGDGIDDESFSPVHMYQDTGCFDIKLIAMDRGCPADTTFYDYICISGPVAALVPDKAVLCHTPGTINFTDSSIIPHHWAWDFGNGQTATTQNASTVYTAPGIYGVKLVVTNDSTGCKDSTIYPIVVSGITAAVDATPMAGCAPLLVSYTNQSAQALLWNFSFGDGKDTVTTNFAGMQHEFSEPGYYHDTLVVMDGWGCLDTLIQKKHVLVMNPEVNFTAADTISCVTLTTQFTDLSTSVVPIVSWFWNFGDGNTSTQQNPTHTFAPAPFEYTVSLTVTDSGGCSRTFIRPNYIAVSQSVASFAQSAIHTCPGFPINFTDLSTGLGLSYHWDFGDGDTSNGKNPTHIYNTLGTYTVSLLVSNAGGCDSLMVKQNLITVDTLTAAFGANPISAPCPPLLTSFTDSSSSFITSWTWNFGDGSGSSLPNPSHLYSTAGLFDVSLIVKNNQGCADTLIMPQLIQVDGPSGSFTFSPDAGCAPLGVQFNSITSNVAFYAWDLGDGNIVNTLVDSTFHTYTQVGSFHPILIIDDGMGCSVSLISPDSIVTDTPPVAKFSASNTLICASQGQILFVDNSTSGKPITSWHWDFGDGQFGNNGVMAHTYANPGTYSVSLAVTNAAGCADTLTKPALIKVIQPPVASPQLADTLSICDPYLIQFADSSQIFDPIASWIWTFGDGQYSLSQHPLHSYANPGTYPVQLTVTDTNGCSASHILTFVAPVIPQADFNLVDSTACTRPFTVSFFANTNNFTSWNWDFGDGNQGAGSGTVHTYQHAGYYSPTLFTTDIYGCKDTLQRINSVLGDSVQANFTYNLLPGCPPIPVGFLDQSFSFAPLNLWIWNFGDGSGSFSKNPIHHYSTEGIHQVQLIVKSALGCRDTISLPGPDIVFPPLPGVPSIARASVESDQSISLKWRKFSGNSFGHYVIYRENPPSSGQFLPVDSTFSLTDTFYLDQNGISPLTQSYCYKILVVDSCGQRSDLNQSQTHCTVELQATGGLMQVDLSWSPYIGWDTVMGYEIYRVMDYLPGNSTLIATVSGQVFSWTDQNYPCPGQNCYRIQALSGLLFHEKSWSDTSCASPLDTIILPTSTVVQATVENDADVRLNWIPPNDPGMVAVGIERSEDNLNWIFLNNYPFVVTTHLDQAANVHERDYFYRTFALDTCGKASPLSNLGRSIYLQGQKVDEVPELSWNPYQDWANGVREYEIEVFNQSNQQWELVDKVSGNQTFYRDEVTDLNQPEYCYRVRGLEQLGNQSYSLSNQLCLPAGARLWAPNVFTPNGDGSFDTYLLVHKNIVESELHIFNRWGQEVFFSANVNQGWDGNFEGNPCAESVYYYLATGTGAHGEKFSVKGYLTLLR
ncbi:MAG: PKD domain-containing protein [Bacteroidia bacterium]|nr:PKD domain-containing protein [Bacteroidia bacterium]